MTHKYPNIFVTVGTTRFDQLILSLLKPDVIQALYSIGCQSLTIQYGKFDDLDTLNLFQTIPNIQVKLFDYTNSLEDFIKKSDLVIGHAGAGTSLEVLRHGKPLLIVINDQLMDNHQQELALELEENKYGKFTNTDSIAQSLKSFDINDLKPFPPHDPKTFGNFVKNLLIT